VKVFLSCLITLAVAAVWVLIGIVLELSTISAFDHPDVTPVLLLGGATLAWLAITLWITWSRLK
jgi:hypothetical protein